MRRSPPTSSSATPSTRGEGRGPRQARVAVSRSAETGRYEAHCSNLRQSSEKHAMTRPSRRRAPLSHKLFHRSSGLFAAHSRILSRHRVVASAQQVATRHEVRRKLGHNRPSSRIAAPPHPRAESPLVFDHTSRRLADLAAVALFGGGPGRGDRALRQPARTAHRAAEAARRSAVGHAAKPARPRRRHQARSQLRVGRGAGRGPARGDGRSAHPGRRIATGVRDRRPRGGASARALPQHARHDRGRRAAARACWAR